MYSEFALFAGKEDRESIDFLPGNMYNIVHTYIIITSSERTPKPMKKPLSLFLLCALLFSSLAACATETNDTPDTTATSETETAVETKDPTKDDYGRDLVDSAIPEDVDFGGADLTIFLRDRLDGIEYGYEFIAEELNGEIVNDAIYKRNLETEEDLGITFQYFSGFGNPGEYKNELDKSVRAADGSYDIAAYYAYFGASWALEGLFYNLNDLPYIDFTKPWWNGNFVDEMTVAGSLYSAVGDISLTSINRLYTMFFNKNVALQYCPDVDFYQLVREGKWTIDTFATICSDLYTDLNGNGERDDDDFYGWSTSACAVPIDGIQAGLGLDITRKNADGTHTFAYEEERVVTGYERTFNLYFNNNGVSGNGYDGNYLTICTNKFMNGTSLFLAQIFKETDILRTMDDDYGVLPLFKLDEAQEGYYTTSHDAYSLISITSSCDTPEAAAAALEKLSETSYKYVTPAYFEVALKSKYARGDQDAEMYDIIIAGRKYNFGMVMSASSGNVAQLWRTLLDARNENFVSTMKSQSGAVKSQLDGLMQTFEKLAEQ